MDKSMQFDLDCVDFDNLSLALERIFYYFLPSSCNSHWHFKLKIPFFLRLMTQASFLQRHGSTFDMFPVMKFNYYTII